MRGGKAIEKQHTNRVEQKLKAQEAELQLCATPLQLPTRLRSSDNCEVAAVMLL